MFVRTILEIVGYRPVVQRFFRRVQKIIAEKLDATQEMRYPNVTSLYFASPPAFNVPDGGGLLGRSL